MSAYSKPEESIAENKIDTITKKSVAKENDNCKFLLNWSTFGNQDETLW